MIEQTQPNVMASNAINPLPSTQATKQEAITPKLQRWIDFCEQTANEMGTLDQYNPQPPFTDNYEDTKKAKAEKRLMAKLKKMEVVQKAALLAEAQKRLEEARRNFEAQEQPPYDYTNEPPSLIEDMKANEELRALEREQKEALYKEYMEKRAKEAGDDWPRIQAMMGDVRFDHIPKYYPGEKEIIAKAFQGHQTVKPKESNE